MVQLKKVLFLIFSTLLSVAEVSAAHSTEAQAVLNVLGSIYGHKVVSSAMANVNWNITEAQNVYSWTGKYPAMNTFDFIHAPYSKDVNKSGWIDYSDITVVNDWWQQGGLVSCMWHWLQPNKSGDGLTYASSETDFDPSDIIHPASAGYTKMMADMEQIAGYLKQMKDLGIPVVWRPLHEGAGNTNNYPGGTAWFWWGSKGATVYKQLWRHMYDYFTNTKGLDNLIWVWNGGINDDSWYPGDEYVDIVGIDYYGNDLSYLTTIYNHLKTTFAGKMVALTECGDYGSDKLPSLQSMWTAGCKWMWAMPWYDNNYNTADSPQPSSHDYYTWYMDAMLLDYVVDRNTMKTMLDAALTGIEEPKREAVNSSNYYDLRGQCFSLPPAHGLYIHKGKKIIVTKNK